MKIFTKKLSKSCTKNFKDFSNWGFVKIFMKIFVRI